MTFRNRDPKDSDESSWMQEFVSLEAEVDEEGGDDEEGDDDDDDDVDDREELVVTV